MPAPLLSRSFCRRGLCAATTLVFLTMFPAMPAFARKQSAFEHAEKLRDTLEARPESTRTHAEYERVLDAYRAVYHSNPADPHAPESVNMVAALLAEEGRIFRQDGLLTSAIKQFDFLRTQYPANPYRASALLAQASIYLHDLHDPASARAAYQQFLRDYPQSPLAGQAHAGLRESEHHQQRRAAQAGNITSPAPSSSPRFPSTRSAPQAASTSANELTPLLAAPQAESTSATSAPIPPPQAAPAQSVPIATVAPASTAAEGQPVLTGAIRAAAEQHRGRLPVVTNVRHWSTPTYTRIAIDLQGQVAYEAARVPNPDRLYFDLHDTRVAPELLGRTIDVTDNGFLERIRVAQFSNNVTRIVLDVNQIAEYSAFFLPNPWRLIIDIHRARPGEQQQIAAAPIPASAPQLAHTAPIRSEPVAASGQTSRQAERTLRDVASVSARPDQQRATSRPTIEPIAASVPPTAAPAPAEPRRHNGTVTITNMQEHEAATTLDGQRSLTRALGLKIGRIVIDAGHGGYDSGTLGPGGLEEKDVVLDVALRLGKLLRQRLGADVIYTRDDDTFIPLEQRTAIANKAQADLFVSVHANSSSDPTARGVEVYYLNFTTSPDALEVAARENAVSDESVYQLSSLVKKITLKDKIDESREFAADVDSSLYAGLERGNDGLRDRGVKKAPFVVLIGANMPSILAEISFLTNPDDASQLHQADYRERIAESLYRGVAKYVNGLSGVRIAENRTAHTGNNRSPGAAPEE